MVTRYLESISKNMFMHPIGLPLRRAGSYHPGATRLRGADMNQRAIFRGFCAPAGTLA